MRISATGRVINDNRKILCQRFRIFKGYIKITETQIKMAKKLFYFTSRDERLFFREKILQQDLFS